MLAGSLFSGHGQLDFGLTLAGIDHAWFCEADPWRREILELRWPGVPIFDDVRAVDGSAPRVDLLVGGFPCRGASTAGDREGMGNPETALWREMARVIGELRPGYCLLENVSNLLAVQRGAAWGEVLGDLEQIGYVGAWDCLSAAAFGAPHLRCRVFAIAALADADGAGELGDRGFGGEPDGRADVGRGPAADSGLPGRQERDGSEPGEPEHAAADSRPASDSDQGRQRTGEQDLRPGQPDAEGRLTVDPARNALWEQPEPERGSGGAAESGVAGEGAGPCGCLWEWIDHGGFCACCHAHLDDPRGLYAEQGDGSHRFADCPAAPDLHRGELSAGRNGSGEHGLQEDSGRAPTDWGIYTGAIARWEEVAGPAPEPLFRGVDARPARRVVRSRLSALGDGVQVQAGELLGRGLMRLERERLDRCHHERSAAA